jgi:RND family efflux transporter MFP subunit
VNAVGIMGARPRAAAIVALWVAGALSGAGCTRHEPALQVVPAVVLAQAVSASGTDVAAFAGEVKPRHEADLGFRIGGKIVARPVDVGARVTKGQPLARLDPTDVALQADAARSAAAAAETEARFAKAEYERYQDLHRQKFVSESALDQKRNAFASNQAKYEQAKANLAVTQNQAGYATLVAPDAGVITAVFAEAGQVVAAGAPVMKLAREAEREIAIAVPEHRIGELKNARAIAASLWANPGKVYAARVREIAPAVDPVTRTFAVRLAVVDADAALEWGMTANVLLQGDGRAGTLVVPLTAIYHTNDGKPAVWVYDPNARTVALTAVTLAGYREDGAIVASGINAGEWIVAAGVNKLRPGQTVRPYDAPGRPVPPAPSGNHAAAAKG